VTTTLPKYARRTDVPAQRTRNALENDLRRWGASQLGFNLEPGRATVAFTLAGLAVRMTVALPAEPDAAEERRRWRELYLVVKAKLVAVSAGISTLEREFLADAVVPDPAGGDTTVGALLAGELLDRARTHRRAIEAGR
jgi:hypothetical protein